MKRFKIKENGFKEIRKQTLTRTVPIILLAMIVGLVAFEYSYKGPSNVNVYPYVIPIIIVALAFGLRKGLKRQKEIYDTYTLSIDEASIIREQANTPSIRLLFSDITKITKSNQGGLVIKGDGIANSILIPNQIDDFLDLEATLKEKCTCGIIYSKPLIQRLMIPLVIAVLGLMATLYISSNKVLVGFSGIVLTGIMIWSFIKMQTNKSIDRQTRKSSYWFIMVTLSIIGIMIYKIFGPFELTT